MSSVHKGSLQTGNKKGSFLSRNSAALDKLAELTKGKNDARSGSGAKNTSNFVFAALSPGKAEAGGDKDSKAAAASEPKAVAKRKRAAVANAAAAAKEAKKPRTIDENSRDSIFGFM